MTPHTSISLSTLLYDWRLSLAQAIRNGDLMEVIAVCSYLGQYTLNVFNVKFSNIVLGTVTDFDAADSFQAALAPLYKALLPAAASFAGIKVQIISPDRFDPQQDTDQSGPGTATGDPLPAQVAGIVALKTGIGERYAQGRLFLPAAGEGDNTGSAKPSAGYLASATNIGNNMLAGGTITIGGASVDWVWVVYSREYLVTNRVTNFVVRTNWGTRRSRSLIGKPDVSPLG